VAHHALSKRLTPLCHAAQVLEALQSADCGLQDPQPEQPAQPAAGLMTIDILGRHMDAAGAPRQVAVEVDGPTHFVSHLSAAPAGSGVDVSYSLDGSTQWRNAMLQHYGYVVVTVPYQEWDFKGRAQRVALLQQRVRAALLAAGVQPGGVLAAA
jgi:hypothetical protein